MPISSSLSVIALGVAVLVQEGVGYDECPLLVHYVSSVPLDATGRQPFLK